MENNGFIKQLEEFLKTHGNDIEGPEPTHDLSHKWVQMSNELKMIEQGIPIHQFEEYMKPRNLEMEYRILRRLTESQYHNQQLKEFHPDICKLNRYANIIPFTHSEVKLYNMFDSENNMNVFNHQVQSQQILESNNNEQVQDDQSLDHGNQNQNVQMEHQYINANYINTSLNDQNYLIVTQGPMMVTFISFYKMVVQENVRLIIMICNLKENERVQCDQYWPKVGNQMMLYSYHSDEYNESFNVKCVQEYQVVQGLYQRDLEVTITKNGQTKIHEVQQLHWTQWPDHGTPSKEQEGETEYLVEKMLLNYLNSRSQKIVVHCSAGIGRTGTLVSLFNLTLSLYKQLATDKEDGRISVFGCVRRLREQRWGMLTNAGQYIYIYNYIQKQISRLTK